MNGPDLLLPSGVPSAPLPEVRNHTPFPSQYYQMMDVGDEIFHVIATRITYNLARLKEDGSPELAQEQSPLVEADQHLGEPAHTSCIQESDLAPYKPQCDILLTHATAYAPQGQALQRWPVGFRVGEMQKKLSVTGPRHIERSLLGWRVSPPEPATQVPLSWELAYGGTCQWPEQLAQDQEPQIWSPYEANPIGRGWADKDWLRKQPVTQIEGPQIEEFENPFGSAQASAMQYPAVGVGPVGKWWWPRRQKAGTYDQEWKEGRWPRLPKDFDFGYWNCAPQDQQSDYLQGGEDIVLVGLMPGQHVWQGRVPEPAVHAVLRMDLGPRVPLPMRLDTVVLDLKAYTLSCVYRLHVGAQFGARVLELRPGRG